MDDRDDPLASALRAEAARLDSALRSEAARITPRMPADLVARTRARVRAEIAAPTRRIAFPIRIAVAAAAALAVAALTWAASSQRPAPAAPILAQQPQPAPVVAPKVASPSKSSALAVIGELPTPANPLDSEIARMRGDARATMSFLIDTLPLAKN